MRFAREAGGAGAMYDGSVTRWMIVIGLAACGGRSSIRATGERDAAVDDANSTDASFDARSDVASHPPPCDPSKPFLPPREMTELDTPAHDGMLRLSSDGLTAYFQRWDPTTHWDLFTATRTSTSDPFASVARMSTLDTNDDEGSPFPAPDGLSLYFGRFVQGATNQWDIEIATRSSPSEPFAYPKLAGLPPQSGNPYLVGDRAIYFVGGPRIDILRTTIPPGPIETILAAPDNEVWPAVTSDELTLYFSQGGSGVGDGMEILVSRRASTSVPFTERSPVKELDTIEDEFPTFVSPDGCTLYFSRTTNGKLDLYVARKP